MDKDNNNEVENIKGKSKQVRKEKQRLKQTTDRKAIKKETICYQAA